MNDDHVTDIFLKITMHRMCAMYLPKLLLALERLEPEQLWTEAYAGGNTIGGIALHVCEHVRRSCLRLTKQEHLLQADFHRYFPNQELIPSQVAGMLEEQFGAWQDIMSLYLRGEWVFTDEHMHQLYHLVEHTGYHLGQIIDRVQSQTGVKFDFVENGLHEKFLRQRIEE